MSNSSDVSTGGEPGSIILSDTSGIPLCDENGNILVSDGTGQISIGGTAITIGGGITPDELKELEHLRKEHEDAIKDKQRELFSKLPEDVRQEVVDTIRIRRLVKEIEEIEDKLPKKARLAELENRNLTLSGAVCTGVSWYPSHDDIADKLIKIFGEEEIIDMHNNIEAEKALLGD